MEEKEKKTGDNLAERLLDFKTLSHLFVNVKSYVPSLTRALSQPKKRGNVKLLIVNFAFCIELTLHAITRDEPKIKGSIKSYPHLVYTPFSKIKLTLGGLSGKIEKDEIIRFIYLISLQYKGVEIWQRID